MSIEPGFVVCHRKYPSTKSRLDFAYATEAYTSKIRNVKNENFIIPNSEIVKQFANTTLMWKVLYW